MPCSSLCDSLWTFCNLTVQTDRDGTEEQGSQQANAPVAAIAQAPQPGLREMRVLFALPGLILSSNNNKLGKGKEKGREGQLATRSLRSLASKCKTESLSLSLHCPNPSQLSGSLFPMRPRVDSQIATEFPGFCGCGGAGVVVSLRDLLPPDPFTGSSRAWGKTQPDTSLPLLLGLFTPLLIAVLTCKIDWQPCWKRPSCLSLGAAWVEG